MPETRNFRSLLIANRGEIAIRVMRAASELGLRITLGRAWLLLQGWSATEVWNAFHPALALAKSLRRNDALLTVLWCLRSNAITRGRVRESFQWMNEALDIAQATGDRDLLIVGHASACAHYFWTGSLTESLAHGDKVLQLYDPEKHYYIADLLTQDPRTVVGLFSSISSWMLGYPDRAVRVMDQNDTHARQRAHPFDLGFALFLGASVFDFRCEPDRIRSRNQECEQLGRDSSLPALWDRWAPVGYAMALIRAGDVVEGVTQLKAGLAHWAIIGLGGQVPYRIAVLAEGMAYSGDLDGALERIDEQIALLEQPGWEERLYYAEVLRQKGWMLSLKGDHEGAEQNYLDSLAWARKQQAKSWELRTSTSLARLWQAQGKPKQAYELLVPIYGWFTEGFDTKDLIDAKALIEELAS